MANSENQDIFSSQPREVYKEQKIKREKHSSRSSEELGEPKESSDEDSSLPGHSPIRTSLTANQALPVLLAENISQEEGVSCSPPARTSSRTYSGITVQHNQSKQGIKLSITLQTPDERHNNVGLMLTAELKRYDRLREIKDYTPDTEEFKALIKSHIDDISQLPKEHREKFCVGRLHDRGQRGGWYQNALAIATMDNNIIKKVFLYLDTEEYEIEMDLILSPTQESMYHSSGVYGEVILVPVAPSLKTAVRKKIIGG